MLSLEEIKTYLRIDSEDEDGLLLALLQSSMKLCMDVARVETRDEFESYENAKIAVLFTIAYLYEHREEADHNALTLTLRALLFGMRESMF